MSRPFKHPKRQTIERVAELRAARYSCREIGEAIGYSTQRIWAICKEFNISFGEKSPQCAVVSDCNSLQNMSGAVPPQETCKANLPQLPVSRD